MKGKTNSAHGSAGTSGGDLILAENALDKDSAEAGEKVLVRRFTAQPEAVQYYKKSTDIICLPILKNRATIVETPSSSQQLVTIEDGSSLKKITDLTYKINPSSTYKEHALLFDDWLIYGNISNPYYSVNINTQTNLSLGSITYTGNENYFFKTLDGGSGCLYKFNTQTGTLDNYFTIFDSIGYLYTYIPLLFYKDTVLLFHAYRSADTLYLYKLNHETHQKEEIVSLKDAITIFSPSTDSICRLSPNCCCVKKVGGGYHVIKIDEGCQTFYYAPINCLGFEDDISPDIYNTTNRTFSVVKQEGAQTFLNILSFNPDHWKELEFVEKIDLTAAIENFRVSIGAEKVNVTKYKSISDDLNRLTLLLNDGSTYYAVFINIRNKLTNWQAVPDFTYNYNACSLTAITTGKLDEHKKIEVKTVLPDKIPVSLSTNNINATITVEGVNP